MVDKQTENAVTDVIKKKRTRPDLHEARIPQVKPGEMSKMIKNAMTIAHWTPINTDDAEQVAERIDKYHQYCYENDMKPDMPGMALALGVDRTTLWRWENGAENKPKAVCNVLKRARSINELLMSNMMTEGKINPVVGIFLLKNSHGYKDQQDVVITPNNPLEAEDAEQTRKKYLEALPEE